MDIKAAVLPAYNKIRRLSFAVKSNRLLACEDFRSLDTLYRDSLLIAHSFEKALCIESCRDDFGTQKADRLLDYLTLAAKDPSFDNHSYAFVELFLILLLLSLIAIRMRSILLTGDIVFGHLIQPLFLRKH